MNQRPDPDTFDQGTIEVEQALIGSCLGRPDVYASVCGMIDAEQFSEPWHTAIWVAFEQLAAAGKTLTPNNLVAALGDGEVAQGFTLARYVARCASESAMPGVMVADLARQVRHAWALREIVACSSDAATGTKMPGADPLLMMGDMMERLEGIRVGLNPRLPRFLPANEVASALVDRVAKNYSGQAKGITTGIRDLDHKLGGGLQKGNLVIMAGRPGMGKTLTAVSITKEAATAGHATGVFSLEMGREQIGSRYVSNIMFAHHGVKVASGSMLYGNLTERQAEQVMAASKEFAELPLHIDDSSGLMVGEVSARTRALADRFAREGKTLELVVIDYLKFLRASDRYRGQRHYEVGEISAGLKQLAKDLNVSVVLLAQLNRAVESREDKRPQLSDLRESGDLEADADQVIFLYREAYYLARQEPKPGTHEHGEWQLDMEAAHNKIEIIVDKNRMGSTGAITAFCDPAVSVVQDMSADEALPTRLWGGA